MFVFAFFFTRIEKCSRQGEKGIKKKRQKRGNVILSEQKK